MNDTQELEEANYESPENSYAEEEEEEVNQNQREENQNDSDEAHTTDSDSDDLPLAELVARRRAN